MGLHELAHEIDIRRIANLQQHDGQIARNGVPPQPGLAAAIADKHRRIGPQLGVGEEDGAGQTGIELGIVFDGVELLQHHLAVGPGQVEDAVRQIPVLILFHQTHGGIAALRHAGHDIDGGRLPRIEGEGHADGDDGIQHRACSAGERRGVAHRQRIGRRSGAADEAQAIRFVGDRTGLCAVHRHPVQHPRRLLAQRTGPARAQDGVPLRQDLGLHEEIAEGRMQRIGGRGRDHHFGVSRYIDFPALPRSVGDAQPAQLDIVLGRDDDLGMGLEIPIAAGLGRALADAGADGVAAAKFGAPLREDRLETARWLERRLMAGQPEITRGSPRDLADVTEGAPVVAGAVFAPARDGNILPAAVTAARLGDHDVVAAVGQQLHLGHRRIRTAEHANRRLRGGPRPAHLRELCRVGKQGGGLGDALLEQQQDRLEQGIRLESPLHRAFQQQVTQGQQTHALVMSHEGPHDRMRLPASLARRRVVDGLEEPEFADKPIRRQTLQIHARRLGRHHQRERRSIGRDHQIFRQAALEPQARHAEGAVLVIQMHVDGVVGGFGDAPGDPALAAVLDLPRHRRLAGLVEQRVVVGGHHQQRHQVFEHRTAPRQQRRFSPGAGEQPPEGKPALLGQLSLGDGDETAQSRFRGQQIVVAGVCPVLGDVVADGQQLARLVEEEVVVHARQIPGAQSQALDGGDALPATGTSLRDGALQIGEPGALRGCPFGLCIHALRVQPCQCAEGRYGDRLVEHGKVGFEPAGGRRQQQPRREERQFFERLAALPKQGLAPHRVLLLTVRCHQFARGGPGIAATCTRNGKGGHAG